MRGASFVVKAGFARNPVFQGVVEVGCGVCARAALKKPEPVPSVSVSSPPPMDYFLRVFRYLAYSAKEPRERIGGEFDEDDVVRPDHAQMLVSPSPVYSSVRASREAFVEIRTREEVRRRRFTVEEYHRMGEVGILRGDERVELIEGEIREMNPIGSRHAACVRVLTRSLGRVLDDELLLDVQNPVRLNRGLEPQPDLAVVLARDHRESLPGPEDVLLVIEVSDTTLSYDRNVKLPLYGRAGIAESWIVDLPNEAIERHNDPSEEGYRRMERVGRGRSLASEALPNLVLHTDAVLGGG